MKERRHRAPVGELEAIVITQLRKRLDAESGPASMLCLDTAPHSEQRRLVADSRPANRWRSLFGWRNGRLTT